MKITTNTILILLGIFADKIGDVFEEQDVEQLSNLKD